MAGSAKSRRTRTKVELVGHPGLAIIITDDGSRTLKDTETGDTWHSESGALSESQKVFIENGGLESLLADENSVRVLEIGFGTGLNFWLAASAALEQNGALHYVSIEPNRLPWSIVRQLEHGQIENCQPAFDHFAQQVFGQDSSAEQTSQFVHGPVQLSMCNGSFEEAIATIAGGFDLIFHDPFSPDSAGQLWVVDVFSQLFNRLHPGGRLLTYCVKSQVQKDLRSTGFDVAKTRGPVGGKREVLIATRPC